MVQRFQKRDKVLIPNTRYYRLPVVIETKRERTRLPSCGARSTRQAEPHRVEPCRRGGGGGGVVEEGRGGGGGESCHFDRHFSAEERPRVV